MALVDGIRAIDVIEAGELVSGVERGGLIGAAPIVAAGSVARRPPVFMNTRGIPSDLRGQATVAFAQKHSVYPNLHLLSLADAVVVGQGSVVAREGGRNRLLRDSAREFLAHRLVPDGMEREAGEQFAVSRPIDRRVEQSCLLLKRPWSNNFGHWLVDQAMALSYLVHIGALPTRDIVVSKVSSSKLRAIMLETLAVILPDSVVHEHPDTEVWQFKNLSYIMPLHVPPMFKLPAALDCLRENFLAVPVLDVAMPRRLYIVRESNVRRLINEPDVIALSTGFGFEPVIPEALSMAQQAMLFHRAEAILGVKGAAMTNILFAQADCRVMLMSPGTFTDPFFWDIASTRGIAYAELFGATTTKRASLGHNDFHVSPADVAAMIQTTLAADSWSTRP